VTGFWRAWALYFGLLAVYLVAFLVELAKLQTARPAIPANGHIAMRFAWSLIYHSFVPGLFGGPWHWWIAKGADDGVAQPPAEVAWLALGVMAGIVIATLLTRRRAWRGWALLFGWLVVADIFPVLTGRVANFPGYAVVLGESTRYVADVSAVASIAVALIFWPVSEPDRDSAENRGQVREFFDQARWRKAAVPLMAVFAVSSVWTVAQYQVPTDVAVRSYITNARAALAKVSPRTVVIDRPVPYDVMIGAYSHNNYTSVVLGPMASPSAHIVWATQPAGNIGPLEMFGPDGRLYAVAIAGVTSNAPSTFADCLTNQPLTQPTKRLTKRNRRLTGRSQLVVPLPVRLGLAPWVRVLRINYLANAAAAGSSVTVTYNGSTYEIPIVGTANNAYVPVTGAAPEVTLKANLRGGTFCFEKAVVGYFVPFPGTGVPTLTSRSAS